MYKTFISRAGLTHAWSRFAFQYLEGVEGVLSYGKSGAVLSSRTKLR